jgi:hypothetical protein
MASVSATSDQTASPRAFARLDLAREFRAAPLGRHSGELYALLNVLRAGAVAGKYCLICVEPHRRWVIGRMSGQRGVAPAVSDNRIFERLEDAEWAVFKLRWAEVNGAPLDEDLI